MRLEAYFIHSSGWVFRCEETVQRRWETGLDTTCAWRLLACNCPCCCALQCTL